MVKYLELVEYVLTHGTKRQGPKPEGTIAVFGTQVKYNLADGAPLITTRDLSKSFTAITAELAWIMSGSTNAFDLHPLGSHLWDRWAEASHQKLGHKRGNLGPTYGKQMTHFGGRWPYFLFPGVNQLIQTEIMLKRDPQTRRAMISLWNMGDVEKPDGRHIVDVAPCIAMLHFARMSYPTKDRGQEDRLDLHLFQRSADVPVGVPFDTAEWGGLFLMYMARLVNLPPGSFIHTMSDAHIYENQIPAMKELLKREPKNRPTFILGDASLDKRRFSFRRLEMVTLFYSILHTKLENYNPHPKLDIPVAT